MLNQKRRTKLYEDDVPCCVFLDMTWLPFHFPRKAVHNHKIFLALNSTLFPVACYGVTEQREELENPWCLKINCTSSEYPVRLRRVSFILFHQAFTPYNLVVRRKRVG